MVTMRKLATLVAALFFPGTLLFAQGTVTPPPLDFSGVLFGNFQWRTDDATKATTGGKPSSRFDVGRAYLTFRMPAGERGSIRVTTDIFQQSPSTYYSGWTVRLKYGYFQYDFTKNLAGVQGLSAVGRVGMLHTVVVEHVEGFWPRFLSQTADEITFGWSSADVGAAGLFTLPNKHGEVYVTVVNGSNYSSGETDRFKDFAGRVSLTPFANDSGFLRTLTISPWYSKGWTASQFVLGGGAQVGPVSDGVQRDRRGLFVGLKDRRITGGAEYSQRVEQFETGANTVAIPRVVNDRTGNLVSGFALVRPLEFTNARKRSPFGLLGRFDSFKLNKSLPSSIANPANTFLVLGTFWDLNARTTFALDYQELKSDVGTASLFPGKTLFLHWVANF
jgi:hypothetical protein